MNFINANTLHRNPGEWGTQHLLPVRQNYDAPAARQVRAYLFLQQANAEQAHQSVDFGLLHVDHFS
jgi:hypothetical protein